MNLFQVVISLQIPSRVQIGILHSPVSTSPFRGIGDRALEKARLNRTGCV
jgi:hypothetical protein